MITKVLAALHLLPLIGYPGFTTYQQTLTKAKQDLLAFREGGVDAVIIENNYNLPHTINETPAAAQMMEQLCQELAGELPLGISVLWNDYETALRIAKKVGAGFIRVPVFVDQVRTAFGEITGDPERVLKLRRNLQAENIQIFADIHVKHAQLLESKSIGLSALQAKSAGADGVIITGNWTGQPPSLQDLQQVRQVVGPDFPIIIGSGATQENIGTLFQVADQVIVSSSLKQGLPTHQERNLYPSSTPIDPQKVKAFMEEVKNVCQEPTY